MTAADCLRVYQWRNQPHIQAVMRGDSAIPWATHQTWFARTLARTDCDYRILSHRGVSLGLANGLHIIPNETCEWGFYLGEQDRPSRSGSAMAWLMLDHLFTIYKLKAIVGEVFAFNSPSLGLHAKFGFLEVPSRRQELEKNGRLETFLSFELTARRWCEIRNELRESLNHE